MSDPAPVAIFRRGKNRPQATRKRTPPPSEGSASTDAAPSASAVSRPTRKAASGILSTSTGVKRPRDEDFDAGTDVKWRATGAKNAPDPDEVFEGEEGEEVLRKRRREAGIKDEEAPDDGLYHGQAGYKSHITKSKEIPKAMRVGPQRSTNTIRQVTIVDYQPDVCKDYKETGYCGFGDTCKFLHDRGTYLAGWQLDKQWEANAAARAAGAKGGNNDSASESEEDIPFACLICRKPYTDPIVTRCGHYFCSQCAIKRFAKTPKCRACGAPTGGMFNRADKVIEKMKKKEEALAAGGEEGDREAGVRVEGLDSAEEDEGESGTD